MANTDLDNQMVWNGTQYIKRSVSPYTYTNPDGTTIGLSANEYNASQNAGVEGLASNANQGIGGTIKDWFTPQGASGVSTGGNVLSAAGSAMGGLAGLASMYYAGKNYDLAKDKYNYQKGLDTADANRKNAFAANAGNGAVYTPTASSAVKL